MTTQDGSLILHLSDLHFGNLNRFADRDFGKLGKAFFRAIEQARTGAGIQAKTQMVIVSGDVAETGDEAEFGQAWQFFDALSGEIGLDHFRFIFAPGNHDVSWPLCELETIQQKLKKFDETELRRRMDAVKFQFYDAMLARIYGKSLAEVPGRRPLACGGWLHDFPGRRRSAVGSSRRTATSAWAFAWPEVRLAKRHRRSHERSGRRSGPAQNSVQACKKSVYLQQRPTGPDDPETGPHQVGSCGHRGRGRCFFLKTDIRKYFDSISHIVLVSRLGRVFKDRRLLDLLERIVRRLRGSSGRGLPIGSLMSQHFANFYLGWFDRFVKETHVVLNRRSRRRFAAKLRDLEQRYLDGEIGDDKLQARSTSLVAFSMAAGAKSWHFRRAVLEQCPVSGR